MSRGGKREGAGRKPSPFGRLDTVAVRVPSIVKAHIKTQPSAGKYITELVLKDMEGRK